MDVGCGTGTVLSFFTDHFQKLIGIDLDEELLKLAVLKVLPGEDKKVELLNENMLELKTIFREDIFCFITCLGNTIPHITNIENMILFFRSIYELLESDGVFVFQMINYDKILDLELRGLDTIKRGDVVFERRYSAIKPSGLIDFTTNLYDLPKEIEIINNVELLPVRKMQIHEFLRSVGFSNIQYFGDFHREAYDNTSPLLICVCRK